MKYRLINKYHSKYQVEKMCKVLKVSKSGYYKWFKTEQKVKKNEIALLVEIKTIHNKSRGTYGYLRVTQELKRMGFCVNKKRIARIMHENGIFGLQTKRYRPKTTISEHNYPVSSNLIDRNFRLKEKNKAWVSDITYVKINNVWCYLCTVIDLANREVVGWTLENHMRTSMVIQAVSSAIKKTGKKMLKGLILHSDRGSQYASHDFREYLKSIGVVSSMSGKGNCYDNAVAESFFATLKREEINRKKYEDIEKARVELFDYIEIFYNRLHSALGYKTPLEAAEIAA